MLEGIFFWQCLRPGLFATSPASLPAPHFGLFASIPIAFPCAASPHIVQAATSLPLPKLAKECPAPSPVVNEKIE